MSGNFCKRTERRLEKLGLEKEEARRFAGFLYVSTMSVCALMGCRNQSPVTARVIRPGRSGHVLKHGRPADSQHFK
jgi:hypothetical protein